MLRGIQHCALVVSDVDRSRGFYGGVLGLEEIPRPSNFTFEGAWFAVGGDEVHLIAEKHTTQRAGTHDRGAGLQLGLVTHVAMEVDDLDATLAGVRERGAEVAGGPMPRGDGAVQAFLLDPDGYVVELFERTRADQRDAPERAPVER